MNVAPLEIWRRYMLAILSCWMEPKASASDPSNEPAGILIAHPTVFIIMSVFLLCLYIYIYVHTTETSMYMYNNKLWKT